ncbi:MAG: histidine phosphatase family protein [Methylococcales bacterium]|nr:histidine phosphatase family protein [Methylococcales bacterium]
MSRELWLLRHGKSPRSLAMDDFDRPLAKRGKRAARRIGVWLEHQRLIPDWIVSSPAKRALATAKIVQKAIAVDGLDIIQNKHLYQEGFERLKTILAECPVEARRVLLVGHNPDLEDLLIHLAGADNLPDSDKLLPTAALARLIMPDDWTHFEPGSAKFLSITTPKSLPDEDVE